MPSKTDFNFPPPEFIPEFKEDTINAFFEYISRDSTGKIGKDFIHFENTLNKLIHLKPPQLTIIYINFLESLELKEEDFKDYHFLYNYNESIKNIEYIKKYQESFSKILRSINCPNDDRPPQFLFALNLWLFIWH